MKLHTVEMRLNRSSWKKIEKNRNEDEIVEKLHKEEKEARNKTVIEEVFDYNDFENVA